jgi:hypothetical protein
MVLEIIIWEGKGKGKYLKYRGNSGLYIIYMLGGEVPTITTELLKVANSRSVTDIEYQSLCRI